MQTVALRSIFLYVAFSVNLKNLRVAHKKYAVANDCVKSDVLQRQLPFKLDLLEVLFHVEL
jgi:hypothetical protein